MNEFEQVGGGHVTCDWPMVSWVVVTGNTPVH